MPATHIRQLLVRLHVYAPAQENFEAVWHSWPLSVVKPQVLATQMLKGPRGDMESKQKIIFSIPCKPAESQQLLVQILYTHLQVRS